MFEKIDEKIKGVANGITIFGIIVSIIGGILTMVSGNVFSGFLYMVIGFVLSWVVSLTLYGFGEIITNLNQISMDLKKQKQLSVAKMLKDIKNISVNEEKFQQVINSIIKETTEENLKTENDVNEPNENECPNCFFIISPDDTECPNCGYILKE